MTFLFIKSCKFLYKIQTMQLLTVIEINEEIKLFKNNLKICFKIIATFVCITNTQRVVTLLYIVVRGLNAPVILLAVLQDHKSLFRLHLYVSSFLTRHRTIPANINTNIVARISSRMP